MQYLPFVLPAILLLLFFCFKLTIGRSFSLIALVNSLLEFPVDIVFLAASFAIAFTISPAGTPSFGLFIFVIDLIVGVVAVILWRGSLAFFALDQPLLTLACGALSYVFAIPALVWSVSEAVKGLQ